MNRIRLSQPELLKLVANLGGYNDEVSTRQAIRTFASLQMQDVGFLDILATATKLLEILASVSQTHRALVCENLLLLHADLQREQN